MKTRQEIIYRCDYCNKSMFNKGAMSLHERMCKLNPYNRHKCFQYCRWLRKDKDYGGFSCFSCGNEKCDLYEIKLHSYKLERDYLGMHRIKEDNLVRMPFQCEHYEIEWGHSTYNDKII